MWSRRHPFAAISELLKSRPASRTGCAMLGLDLQRDLLDLFTKSAGD